MHPNLIDEYLRDFDEQSSATSTFRMNKLLVGAFVSQHV